MKFELNPEVVDQIIFAMENQEQEFVLDTKTMTILPMSDIPEDSIGEQEDRYEPLPEWHSVHGFNLMEKFVSTLRNPIYRENLREILSSGKGVFRHFKDAVKQRKDIERLWFVFKEREMKQTVIDWYNRLREAWGLDRVDPEAAGIELRETEELILSDFLVRPESGEHLEIILELDRKAFDDSFPDESPEYVECVYRWRRAGITPELSDDSLILIAETPVGELAGFVWGVEDHSVNGIIISRLLQVYVLKEFRGLGLAKVLLHQFLTASYERNVDRIMFELYGGTKMMEETVRTFGFAPFSQVMELNLDSWEKEQ